jgi:hypothetical protein
MGLERVGKFDVLDFRSYALMFLIVFRTLVFTFWLVFDVFDTARFSSRQLAACLSAVSRVLCCLIFNRIAEFAC